MTSAGYAGTPAASGLAPIEQYFTVAVHGSTLIAVNNQSSPFLATLTNNDTTNGIWISATPSVQPGQGTFLGPLGSIVWNNQTLPPYACLAAGGTTPVQVAITTNAANIQNPTLEGVAIAAALSVTGIPTAFLGQSIFGPTGPTIINQGFFDVSAYASVFITMTAGAPQPVAVPPPVGHAEPGAIVIKQGASTGAPFGFTVMYDKCWSMLTAQIPPFQILITEGQLCLAIPVRGPFMSISGVQVGGGATVFSGVSAYGTNRQLDDDLVTNGSTAAVIGNVAFPAGATRNLPVLSANTLTTTGTIDYFISSGGPATISMIAAPAGGSVLLYATEVGPSGQLFDILLGAFTALNIAQTIQLPKGMISFTINVPATAGTYAWSLSMNR